MNENDFDNFTKMLNYATGQVVEKEIDKIEIEKLAPFPQHKFKLYSGERLENMVQSIKEYGVLLPIIVWKNNNDYIILSGHNRVEVCKILNIQEIPCVIKKDLTLNDATLIVTETNLMQRSFTDLSHSERAYTLEQHYKSIKSQGKRTDLLKEIGKLMLKENKSLDKLSSTYNLSKNTIARYMRLAKLIKPLLDKIDNEKLPIRVGYNLSFIESNVLQEEINLLLDKNFKLDIVKSEQLKKLYLENILTVENLQDYFNNEEKLKKVNYLKINSTIVEKYFDKNQKPKDIENVIDKALSLYFENSI